MAVMTLRPNAVGDENALTPIPVVPNWQNVDEVAPDEDATIVMTYNNARTRDLYDLPISGGAGVINFIKIYTRSRFWTALGSGNIKPSLKSDGVVTDGVAVVLTAGYVTISEQWNLNPADAGAWEWADIDALQIGVSLRDTTGFRGVSCTQVYVEVDYVSGWVGKISGVTDPAEIMGVAKTDIAAVKGVV